MKPTILIPIARSLRNHIKSELGIKTACRIDTLRFMSNNRRVGWYRYINPREEKVTIKILDRKEMNLSDLSRLKKLVRKHLREVYEVCAIDGVIRNVKITLIF